MDFLPSVIRATYVGGFRIQLTFNDNLEGTVDLQSWLDGPIFEPLKEPSYNSSSSTAALLFGRTARISHPRRCTTRSNTRGRPNIALEPTAPVFAERRGSARTLCISIQMESPTKIVEHHHGPLGDPDLKPYGNGVVLWFEVEDFEAVASRAQRERKLGNLASGPERVQARAGKCISSTAAPVRVAGTIDLLRRR